MTAEPITCPKCEGKGWIPRHANYHGGECFRCKGRGKVSPLRATKPKVPRKGWGGLPTPPKPARPIDPNEDLLF